MTRSPRFLLDTNICIYIINRKPPGIFERFSRYPIGAIAISSITGAELWYGVSKSGSARNQQALARFLAPLDVLPFDDAAMQRYGSLCAYLERQGTPIGPMDLLIAAHAQALGCTLVSNNTREFDRVPELMLENWVD